MLYFGVSFFSNTHFKGVPLSSYLELKAQAEALLAQAETVRQQELAAVIQDIKDKMSQYGLSAADLGLTAPSAAVKTRVVSKSKSKAPAKYRGPNGETWAGGLGRKPEWVRALLAAGENMDKYLI